jgi:hypothetical protein
MSTGVTIGCCPECAERVRAWFYSGHPLANRWIARIRRACKNGCQNVASTSPPA